MSGLPVRKLKRFQAAVSNLGWTTDSFCSGFNDQHDLRKA